MSLVLLVTLSSGLVGVTAGYGTCLLSLTSQLHLRSREIATPAAPSRKLTSGDWEAAAGKFIQIPQRRPGVQETLFAKPTAAGAPPHKCGTPCVAHCIAGQPRDMISVKGLWKSIKYRLFQQFSEDPVVFALLAMGAQSSTSPGGLEAEGTSGFVRTPQGDVTDEQVRPSLEFLGVSRALLLREACTNGACLQKGLRLKCDAKELGLKTLYDAKTGVYQNLCEIQVSRFRDALELVRDYEAEHHMKFDWVTRPRPDVYFTRPVVQAHKLDITMAHVAPFAACGYGGMDWFYAIPRQLTDTFADFATNVSCSDYNSNPEIAKRCATCPGCECWMAAWMYAKNVPFQALPWHWFTPAKFCGGNCPADWEVTPSNIMGMDDRVPSQPCVQDAHGVQCPAALEQTAAEVHWQDILDPKE